MCKQPSEFATFLSIWSLCLLSSLTAVEAFCSMSVTVYGVDKSEDTIVVPKKTPVAVDCHPDGTLYRGDKPYPSRFPLTESTQGSFHCRCSGGSRTNEERILVVEPGFEDDERMTLTGFKGDNMTIPCGLTGTLQGVTYETTWSRNYTSLPSEQFRKYGRNLVIENVTEEDTTYDYRCIVVKIGNSRLYRIFVHSDPRRIQLIESPVPDISHKVTQGEILCSTQDSTVYPGDRYCLYVEDSGGERHEVECDDRPVSGDVEELIKFGNTAVCTVNRTTTGSILERTVSNEVTHTITATSLKHPFPMGDTGVSFTVLVVVIIVVIVVSCTTAMIIVIKCKHSRLTRNPAQVDVPQVSPFSSHLASKLTEYEHSKLTTNPTQSDSLLESLFSSPSNLTVYHKKDVKRFEKIGRGSFWKVYRGKLSDSRCAIKRLRGVKKGGDHEGLYSKVLRELDMWSSLNHANIISLYGIYHEDDINIPLLIVELMDRNLTDQLNSTFDPTHRKSLFPLKTKLSILSQVAGALDYLHCIKRVIHGDLTANNILLKENSPGSFTSKLTDFGMSRAPNEQDNVMSTVQGTYSYMPPEVQNAGETTTKVDIYSFGVLCVHVLSHRFPKPLHALTMDGLGACVVVSEFSRYSPYLMELDDDEKLLEPLIEECLQYEPEDRLRPEEVIGQLNSIEGRLSLKETGPANPSHQPSVIHQQFSGPIVSGCTISGSVMNVGSFTNGNMQSLPVADTAPLPAPLEVIPEVSFGDNIPNTSTSLTAPSEVNPA